MTDEQAHAEALKEIKRLRSVVREQTNLWSAEEKKLFGKIVSAYLEQLSIKALQTTLVSQKQNCFAQMKQVRELLSKFNNQ